MIGPIYSSHYSITVHLIVMIFLCAALRHHGCWEFNLAASYFTRSLEGTTSDLRGNPLYRERAVIKCGEAAQRLNYRYFGVGNGYCYSGSNSLGDYQEERSSSCRGGNGGGLYVIDLYEITEERNFRDSAAAENI